MRQRVATIGVSVPVTTPKSIGLRFLFWSAVCAGILVAVATACGDTVANPCMNGGTSCNGKCTFPNIDPENCGECGTVCGAAKVCSHGVCVSVCGQGQDTCTVDAGGGFCTNLKSDNLNCGACGTACKPLQSCVGGMCGDGCPQGQVGCIGESGPPFCANVMSDNLNCGACGNKCGPQMLCTNGMCASSCVQGQTACAPEAGPTYCAKLDTDQANCGACGNVCGLLEVCVMGKCSATCLMSQTLCTPDGGMQPDGAPAPSFCTDLKSDNANCGMCLNQCPLNMPLCSNGTCVNPG
jgi:hypothetical protein